MVIKRVTKKGEIYQTEVYLMCRAPLSLKRRDALPIQITPPQQHTLEKRNFGHPYFSPKNSPDDSFAHAEAGCKSIRKSRRSNNKSRPTTCSGMKGQGKDGERIIHRSQHKIGKESRSNFSLHDFLFQAPRLSLHLHPLLLVEYTLASPSVRVRIFSFPLSDKSWFGIRSSSPSCRWIIY